MVINHESRQSAVPTLRASSQILMRDSSFHDLKLVLWFSKPSYYTCTSLNCVTPLASSVLLSCPGLNRIYWLQSRFFRIELYHTISFPLCQQRFGSSYLRMADTLSCASKASAKHRSLLKCRVHPSATRSPRFMYKEGHESPRPGSSAPGILQMAYHDTSNWHVPFRGRDKAPI